MTNGILLTSLSEKFSEAMIPLKEFGAYAAIIDGVLYDCAMQLDGSPALDNEGDLELREVVEPQSQAFLDAVNVRFGTNLSMIDYWSKPEELTTEEYSAIATQVQPTYPEIIAWLSSASYNLSSENDLFVEDNSRIAFMEQHGISPTLQQTDKVLVVPYNEKRLVIGLARKHDAISVDCQEMG